MNTLPPDFVPASPGVARDLRERTDLSAETPFFGSREEATEFARRALDRFVPALPQAVHYVDFGGGQGAVAAAFRDLLQASGRSVQATVVDANRDYLAVAMASGAGGVLANIEDCRLSGIGLASMRLVNHYNDAARQRRMLRAIRATLANGAPFVSQIETGHPLICRIHTEVSNLPSLTQGSPAGFYWPALPEYLEWLAAEGFSAVAVVHEGATVALSMEQALHSAWRRFHGRQWEQSLQGPAPVLERLLQQRQTFFRDAEAACARQIQSPEFAGTEAARALLCGMFQLCYPVVAAIRSE